jgi:5-methylcytosine-specific restriction endonuclease McrA
MMSKRPHTPHEVRLTVAASQEWKCADCRCLLSAAFEIDHCVPLHKGGEHCIANMAALCGNCHNVKSQQERIERLQWTRNIPSTKPEPLSAHESLLAVQDIYRAQEEIGQKVDGAIGINPFAKWAYRAN